MTLGIFGCEDEPDELLDSGKNRFVLVIGIDGLQVEALEAAWTPVIDDLSKRG